MIKKCRGQNKRIQSTKKPKSFISSHGICFASLTILCVLSGCQNTPATNAATLNAPNQTSSKIQQETLWSSTLHWNGSRFRFELPTDSKNTTPQIERKGNIDILRVGELEVELVRTRFRIAGVNYRWQPDSIIWIHRPPQKNQPFFRQQGQLQLSWLGNGINPVVEEQLSDGSFVWTMGAARVIRDADGTAHYRGRSPDQTRFGPWRIYIDPAGRLIGALQ